MEGEPVVSLRVGLLGSVTVWRGEQQISAGPPRQAAVLGVLAARAGQVVSRAELISAVWGSIPPTNADGGVYTYVNGLRKLIEPRREPGHAPEVLISTDAGYLLRAETDAASFAASLERARRLRAAGDPSAVVAALRDGLSMWRGIPYDGVPGPFAESERLRLRELKATAAEDLADGLLALASPAEAIPGLIALITEHPLRERPRGQLMTALRRCGRQAEALRVYADTRQVLADELGLDPGAELNRIYQEVLASDSAPDSSVPAQVPLERAGFAGRHAELDLLWSLLPDGGGAVPIALVTGTAGVGKTTLAIRFARRVGARFPDGQLYLNMRGFDPSGTPVEPRDALGGFFEALGVEPQRVPETLDAQVGLYRSLLADKRILVLLDNVRSADQVRPLLPASPGCMAVITSRSPLAGLIATEGARPVNLDVLSPAESRQAIAARLGAAVDDEPEAADELIRLCAGLPLALSVASARAAVSQVGRRLSTLVAELRDRRQRLDALAIGDTTTDVRHVFSWSYQQLSDPAARTFRLLGLHPGPDLTAAAAASLTGMPVADARRALAELAGTSLLTEHAPGRYSFHDLLRAYASEQAATEPEANRAAAANRMFDYYMRSVQAAVARIDPSRDTPNVPPSLPGVCPDAPASRQEALDWLRDEHVVARAVATRAFDLGANAYCWHIAWALGPYLVRYAQRYEDATTRRLALTAAERLVSGQLGATGQPTIEERLTSQGMLARSLSECACPDVELVTADTGHDMLTRAIGMFTERQDRPYLAMAHHRRAALFISQDRTTEALSHAHEALRLRTEHGDPIKIGFAENALSWFYLMVGEFEQARAHSQRAVNLLRGQGADADLADALDDLGRAYSGLGNQDEAITCFLEAISLYRRAGNVSTEWMSLTALGDAYLLRGDYEDASIAWRTALRITLRVARDEAPEVQKRIDSLPTLMRHSA
jgi:DNA-binding SARP family transcriptional activator/tetratricopeptide (TPR) repeat protein